MPFRRGRFTRRKGKGRCFPIREVRENNEKKAPWKKESSTTELGKERRRGGKRGMRDFARRGEDSGMGQ